MREDELKSRLDEVLREIEQLEAELAGWENWGAQEHVSPTIR
jgi:hypothetical protein